MKSNPDVLIVGSGPIGIAGAKRLAERNLQVMVLEAGSAITNPAGSHFRNQPRIQQEPDGYFAAIEPYLQPVSGNLPGAADSSLVGGQGILWTNNCPRASEFERWEAMSPDEWEQRYAEAEDDLQVLPDPAANSQTGRRLRQRLQDALSKEGRSVDGLPLSGRVLPTGDIHFNGPSDILEAAAPEVRDRITIRSGVRVKRLRHEGRRATGVDVDGLDVDRSPLEAPIVILAGGSIATPRLLYGSGVRPDALGRGFSFHALLVGQIILEPQLCPVAGEADIAPREFIPPTVDTPWHLMVLRDTCPLPSSETVENLHRLVEMQAFLPVEFREDNALVMRGDDRVEFQFAFSEGDRERMAAMEADLHRLAPHLGRWRRGCEPTWLPHGGAHIVGTCRMDRPDWGGVANDLGRVHGFDNLYLSTVGLLPAPVGENPTLTGVALALRTCDHLVS